MGRRQINENEEENWQRVQESRGCGEQNGVVASFLCGTTAIAMASEGEAEATPATRKRLSCTTCIDNLWFCYYIKWMNKYLPAAPVHQLQQYYRIGVLDNCADKWSSLLDCLNLKTKRSSEVHEILENREKEKPRIWTYRTIEESTSHWKGMFGHLDDME